ncbi:hypothetical protein [Allokutzneria oryzae]|uniref:Uncharacterized protein n=1 Tax=Allokutzneria oryzae TaxID=1378989 RepID=A0ABV5ZSB0_9PSEU
MKFRELGSSCSITTDAGFCGLWQPEAFAHITEFENWEDEVADDSALRSFVQSGLFVPINVGGDGAFQADVREVEVPGQLTERESEYRLVSSEPYLFVSRGALEIGGIEAVGSYSGVDKSEIPLSPGRYSVVIHLIDWNADPGSVNSSGEPTSAALPDFVVEIFAELQRDGYRSSLETFEQS